VLETAIANTAAATAGNREHARMIVLRIRIEWLDW
jgi:hypothetical protein